MVPIISNSDIGESLNCMIMNNKEFDKSVQGYIQKSLHGNRGMKCYLLMNSDMIDL